MVLTVSGSTVTTVECWGGTKNKIAVGGYFNGSAKTLKDIAKKYTFTAVYRYHGATPPAQKPEIMVSNEKYPGEGTDLQKGKNSLPHWWHRENLFL